MSGFYQEENKVICTFLQKKLSWIGNKSKLVIVFRTPLLIDSSSTVPCMGVPYNPQGGVEAILSDTLSYLKRLGNELNT
jgi:hypothetical protein